MELNNKYRETPYYVSKNNYNPSFKISRRKVLPLTNIDNYRVLLNKTDLEDTYFYTSSLQKIMKTSLKIKR